MNRIRPPAVAGMFYTGDAAELRQQIEQFLAAAHPARSHAAKAIIAPHAGYIYSGPIAGSAYAPLRERAAEIERVVLLGPAHRVYVQGIAASSADQFSGPLGDVPVDRAALDAVVAEFDFVFYNDEVHRQEHSLEVQLPFLQSILDDFKLLPFAVGDAHPTQVEQLLERLWGGPETLIVISSDLSHYHDYATAQQLDSFTSDRIAHLDPAAIGHDNACGQVPIRGLLRSAARHKLACEVVDQRNSGDTAGGRDQVVGYGAYVFTPADPKYMLKSEHRQQLTQLARDSIKHGLQHGRALEPELHQWPEEIRAPGSSFVTINLDGQLRGCVGSLEAHQPLVQNIAHNAFAAAFSDHRFSPLTATELNASQIHISVLTTPEPLQFRDEEDLLNQLRPGIDGLVISDAGRRGTFLPSVWESLPERHGFLRHLKQKAGLHPEYWSPTLQVARYTTESW